MLNPLQWRAHPGGAAAEDPQGAADRKSRPAEHPRAGSSLIAPCRRGQKVSQKHKPFCPRQGHCEAAAAQPTGTTGLLPPSLGTLPPRAARLAAGGAGAKPRRARSKAALGAPEGGIHAPGTQERGWASPSEALPVKPPLCPGHFLARTSQPLLGHGIYSASSAESISRG